MKISSGLIALFTSLIFLSTCSPSTKTETNKTSVYPEIKVVGAMKNVMSNGELGGIINIDTITNKEGLYAIGPKSYLQGELLVVDGKSYLSTVTSDSTMKVEQTFDVSAPFLVYGNVNEWKEIQLPSNLKTIQDLETFVDSASKQMKRPFTFKLEGQIEKGIIHIQNLAEGSKVSSPKEAHRGQVNYNLEKEDVTIVGFFSTKHKGIFTHHDSFIHLHLITADRNKMGHLDKVEFQTMKLFLPVH